MRPAVAGYVLCGRSLRHRAYAGRREHGASSEKMLTHPSPL